MLQLIQWYPGHMAKTMKEIEKNLKHVDLVIELVDARAPFSSQNPFLQPLIERKQKIVLFMKADLADETITAEWVEYYKEKGHIVLPINVNENKHIESIIRMIDDLRTRIVEQRQLKGIVRETVRALIIGVPNVGKSTLINRLVNKRIAKIGDRPGITKLPQWIKVNNRFELLDTPGVLWPKFENEMIGKKLALIGTIKYELVPEQDVVAYLLQELYFRYSDLLSERYQLSSIDDMWDVFETIGKKRGALESGGHVNFDKVANIVLQDFRTGRIGRVSLERPIDLEEVN